jgi:Sec-independent protein secretion pathway component TatC
MPTAANPQNHTMSFGDHLEELRWRLFMALIVPLPLAIVLFFLSDPIMVWLYEPLDRVLAAFLSSPWILWQLWLFVRPGLYGHERRFVHFLLPGSAFLTVSGLALMYFVMLPLMLQVLVHIGSSLHVGSETVKQDPRVVEILEANPAITLRVEQPKDPQPGAVWVKWPQMDLFVAVEAPPPPPDDEAALAEYEPVEVIPVTHWRGSMIAQEFRLTTYINFVLLLMLGIVIAFQMPLVIVLLGWLGILTAPALRAKRKYALLICAVVAAMITPADALSMLMMLVPLVALYELSILLLVIAPASAVAEGTILKRLFRRRQG